MKVHRQSINVDYHYTLRILLLFKDPPIAAVISEQPYVCLLADYIWQVLWASLQLTVEIYGHGGRSLRLAPKCEMHLEELSI